MADERGNSFLERIGQSVVGLNSASPESRSVYNGNARIEWPHAAMIELRSLHQRGQKWMESKTFLISEEFYLLYYKHARVDEIAYRNFG